jgi:hypothetical protein
LPKIFKQLPKNSTSCPKIPAGRRPGWRLVIELTRNFPIGHDTTAISVNARKVQCLRSFQEQFMNILRHRAGHSCSLILGLLIILWCAAPPIVGAGSDAVSTSMIALIAAPNRFDGKVIRTTGVLCLTTQDEGDALYLHEEDLRFAIDANSLTLHVNEEQKKRFHAANLRHVLLEGTFHANAVGAYQAGSISQLRRVEIWESDEQTHARQSSNTVTCPVAINPKPI